MSTWQLGWDALGSIAGLVSLLLYVVVEWEKLKNNKAVRTVALFLILLAFSAVISAALNFIIRSGGIPYFAINTTFISLAGAMAYWLIITRTSQVRGTFFVALFFIVGGVVYGWLIGKILSDPMGYMEDWVSYWLSGVGISWGIGWLVNSTMNKKINTTTAWFLGGILGGAYIYVVTWIFTIIGYGNTFGQGATFTVVGFTIGLIIWLSSGLVIQIKSETLDEAISGWAISALLVAILGGLYVWLIPWNITWIATWFIFWIVGWLIGGWFAGIFDNVTSTGA